MEEFRRDLEEVVDMLKTAKDSPCQWGSAPGPVHCDVICDGCDNIITGPRYKCGYVIIHVPHTSTEEGRGEENTW